MRAAGFADDEAAPILGFRFARQKHDADGELLSWDRRVAHLPEFALQQGPGNLGENACAIAGFGIGGDRPAMGQVHHRLDRQLQNPVTRAPVEIGHKAGPAAILRLEDIRDVVLTPGTALMERSDRLVNRVPKRAVVRGDRVVHMPPLAPLLNQPSCAQDVQMPRHGVERYPQQPREVRAAERPVTRQQQAHRLQAVGGP